MNILNSTKKFNFVRGEYEHLFAQSDAYATTYHLADTFLAKACSLLSQR